MNFYKKVSNNSRKVGIFLLFSLIQLVFPQIAVSQEPLINNELSEVNFEVEEVTIDTYEQLPIAGEREARRSFYLTVTAYSSTVDQCDSDPFTTASGKTVHDSIGS